MRIPSLLAVALVAFTLGISCAKAATSDEDAVRAVAAKETAAWLKYDPKAVASLYTADAIWQNPFGVRIHGSAQLEKFLTNLFARPGYRSAKDTSAAKVIDIRFPAPNVAVLWSDESSAGQIDDTTGKPMKPRHSYYLEVLVKLDRDWKISECLIADEIQHP